MERWEQFQGVYVHTPFCLQKCLYCDFPSYAGFPEEVRQRYVDALCREIEVRSLQRELPVAENATMYFGGGTPTVLTVEQIGKIVSTLKHCGWWNDPAEATVEANPGTVNAGKLKALREIGFDRTSLGVQSLQNKELLALGRVHTAEQALYAIEEAKQAGFRRINADLMSGIPCQTVESFRDTMDKILQMNLSHISAYSLILEEGTPLERMVRGGKVQLPDEEVSYNMYAMTTDVLAKAGLQRYEISNYALPGYQSRHNSGYWTGVDYAGFGLGASSLLDGRRMKNPEELREYLCDPAGSRHTEEILTAEDRMAEYMILGLRMMHGVSEEEFFLRFGMPLERKYGEVIRRHTGNGLLIRTGGRVRLTREGIPLCNVVMRDFL